MARTHAVITQGEAMVIHHAMAAELGQQRRGLLPPGPAVLRSADPRHGGADAGQSLREGPRP
jgi:hypothetical protein